jgi:hypothetical protein
MENDLSRVREDFHRLKCVEKRIRFMPRGRKEDKIYKKVIYNPYFSIFGRHGSILLCQLDTIGCRMGIDLEVYKNTGARTSRYELDARSPIITEKDLEVFRQLLNDQIELCDSMVAICKHHNVSYREIASLGTRIEKVKRAHL